MRTGQQSGLLGALSLLAAGLTALVLPVSAGATSGQVCMGVVIDDGPGAAPSVQGVNVTPGTTSDLQAMSTAGDTVTQNDSGLVCAINGYPPDGLDSCLSARKGQYFYWSYWQGDPGTNTWTYASDGPASHDVSAGQDYVEGWRYLDPGPDNPTAPPPRVTAAAAFAQVCSATTTSTTSGTGRHGHHGGGSGGSVPTTTPTTAPATQPTTAPAPGGVPRTAGSGYGVTTSSDPKGVAGVAPLTASAGSSTTTSSTAVGAASHQKVGADQTRLAEADATSHGQKGGGDPLLPTIIVVVVIALLGVLSWFRWRRRPAEE